MSPMRSGSPITISFRLVSRAQRQGKKTGEIAEQTCNQQTKMARIGLEPVAQLCKRTLEAHDPNPHFHDSQERACRRYTSDELVNFTNFREQPSQVNRGGAPTRGVGGSSRNPTRIRSRRRSARTLPGIDTGPLFEETGFDAWITTSMSRALNRQSEVAITLAPKKLILTRRASEGSASEPSLARRVSMCKDAKLSCRGNSRITTSRAQGTCFHGKLAPLPNPDARYFSAVFA